MAGIVNKVHLYTYIFFLPLWAIVGLQLTSCWTLSYCWLTRAKVACSRLKESGLRKFCAKTAWGLGRDEKVERLSIIVVKASFRLQAPGIPCDWSILTVYVNTYVNHVGSRAGLNKRGELVKPYYTAHFHILTFLSFLVFWHEKRFCGSGRGSRRTQSASSPVVLGDFGCDVTCQACRSRSVPSLLWWFE